MAKVNNSDYFAMRERKSQQKIRQLLANDLPEFCNEFFIALEGRTSVLTRLNYAYDLRTFFNYALENLYVFMKISDPKLVNISDLEKISSYQIEQYLSFLSDYERKDGKTFTNKNRGKARKLSAIKSLYQYFYKRGDLKSNISAKVDSPKIPEKEIIRLERKEVNDLLDAVETGNGLTSRQQIFHAKTKTRDMAIVSLFLGTGIRVSELVGLNLNDMDFTNNNFVVTRKGGNRVILYINAEVKQFVMEYYDIRKDNPQVSTGENALFLNIRNKRLSTRAVENIINKYSSIATPLKKITPHKLRSTFGTELYRSTGDIYVVADVLGHKDVNTTKKHYAAVTEDVRKKAAQYVKLYTDSSDE